MRSCLNCGADQPDWSTVQHLAELIAAGETNSALEVLHGLLPRAAPLPYVAIKRVADRRAQAPLRAS